MHNTLSVAIVQSLEEFFEKQANLFIRKVGILTVFGLDIVKRLDRFISTNA